jgi:hypothetical protein
LAAARKGTPGPEQQESGPGGGQKSRAKTKITGNWSWRPSKGQKHEENTDSHQNLTNKRQVEKKCINNVKFLVKNSIFAANKQQSRLGETWQKERA